MHGRIVNVQVTPENLSDATDVWVNSVVPAAKEQTGFRGALLFTDSETGRAVSITLWESESDLMAGQQSGYYTEQIAKFSSYLTRAPTQDGFELVFSEMID